MNDIMSSILFGSVGLVIGVIIMVVMSKLGLNKNQQNIIEYRKQLLEYCAMDTSELLAVYKWLKQLID